MTVRNRPSGLRLFVLVRASLPPQIRVVPIVNLLLTTAVTLTHGALFGHKITLTATSFTLIGPPWANFPGFRHTAPHDRYGEARKVWG